MNTAPQEILKEYVKSQNYTSTAEIMEAMKEMFRDVIQTAMEVDRALVLLWAQVRRMVYRYAARWAAHGGGGVTAEDLHQEGFIAMLQAVDHFDPSLGTKFSTLLHVYLKKAFSVATGQQTTRSRLDPLQTAISLDAPLDDDLDLTLADVLPDPAAEARLLDIDERDRRDRLHADLEDALHTLTDEEQRTIRARYFQGLTLSEIAQTEGISKSAVSLLEQRAMRHLRHPSRTRALRKYQL